MEKLTNATTKPLINICGVYKIKIKSHIYIGSSNHMGHRLRQHRNDLIRKKHHNHTMQNCFNKYGIDTMEFEIVEQCAEDKRIEREAYYIKTLKPDMNHILDPVNIVRDQDTIERTRQSQLIYYQTHHPINAKKVYQYTKAGEFVKEWEVSSQAENELSIAKGSISQAARGDIKTAGGYQWRYEYYESLPSLIKEKPIKIKKKPIRKNRRKVYQYDLQGEFLQEYESITAAAQAIGADVNTVRAAANPKNTAAKSGMGYLWSFEKKDSLAVYQNNSSLAKIVSVKIFDIKTGEEMVYKSIADAVRSLSGPSDFDSNCATLSHCANYSGYYNNRYLCTTTNIYHLTSRNCSIYNTKTGIFYKDSKEAANKNNTSTWYIKKWCVDLNNTEWTYVNACARVKLRESGKLFE